MKKFIAAIDQGTTSTRCILFDPEGRIESVDQKEHEQIYPQPGWVEHNPLEIWQRTREVIQGALQKANIAAPQIAAVGVTNQRETTILWNPKTGQPYGNAIVWQDTRTKQICDQLSAEGGQDRFREKVGLPLATYFSGPKIKWMLDHIATLREEAQKGNVLFGNIDTWIIWQLSGGVNGGVHITDVTNASRTMLMNLKTLDWDDEILCALDIPRQILPQIVPSSPIEPYAYTRTDGPFGGAIPICGDVGDQQAALIGQTCFDTGEAKNTYGTGCFMLMNTGTQIVHSTKGLLTTLAYQVGNSSPTYALEGSVAITGALVQWMRDNLGLISSSQEIESLARTVEDNGGIYFVPAFSGLFAPYWRSDARGVIVGLTRYVNKGHLARAVLEATAFQTKEILEAMRQDSGVELKSLKVDGGMVRNELLMQFQADILNVPVIRPKVTETTALGAAFAAGLCVRFWSSLEELRQHWQAGKVWYPKMNEEERQRQYRYWLKAVERSFNWIEE
ncbi:MAG: glycerol kinase GlpK [Anaerolineales bacterium]|nr:glycerol kinase GlpK [Anaerolineales bacterium]MDW8447635.1 glycerol kinase GlpK [Anaerolineales bacterium]